MGQDKLGTEPGDVWPEIFRVISQDTVPDASAQGHIIGPIREGKDAMIVEDVAGLRRVLQGSRVIAVVGLSANWNRPSHFAAKYMLEHGYTIIPVNPGETEILGQKCYPDLAAIPLKVDMVDVFRKPEDVMPIADEAIRIGAKCLWLQLGVISREAADKTSAAGLDVVMDRCVKIEYARLFGGLNFAGVNTGVISAKRPPCPPLQG